MYKKLKFFKMFLGTILMTLTLISVLKSCSYAYTYDEFTTLCSQCVSSTFAYTSVKESAQKFLDYKSYIDVVIGYNNLDLSDCTTFFICPFNGNPSTSGYVFACFRTDPTYKFDEQPYKIFVSGWPKYVFKLDSNNSVSIVVHHSTNTTLRTFYGWPNNGFLVGLFNPQPSGGTISTSGQYYYIQNLFNQGPIFTSVDNGTISVTNEVGSSFTVKRLPFNRTVTSWKIGRITNISDDVVYIKGHFGPLISSNNDGNIFNTKYQFIWRKGARVESNGFTIAEDGNVYINTQYLIPNQTYECWFLYSTNNINTHEFGQTMYFAYYSNTSPNNPGAISSDLNDDTDIGFINAFGDIVSPDKEDINNTVDNIFTNPYGSGEFFGITYDDDFDDWGFGTFIYNLIQGIITTFTSFNNVTMDFGVLGAINSSAFSIGNSYVGAFLSFFCNAILVITLIFWYYRLVKSFATLDLTTISKYDFDKMFNIF